MRAKFFHVATLALASHWCYAQDVAIPQTALPEEMAQAAVAAAVFKIPDFRLTQGCTRVLDQPPPLRPMIEPFVGRVRDIHEYFMSAPGAGTDLNDRIRKRNAAVRAEFAGFDKKRSDGYLAYRCEWQKYQTCTSSAGNTKRCKNRYSIELGREFIPSTITYAPSRGTGLVQGPVAERNNQSIYIYQRKSGSGRAKVTIYATAQLIPSGVPGMVARELDVMRAAVRAAKLPTDREIDP